jgi:hypothetical protein
MALSNVSMILIGGVLSLPFAFNCLSVYEFLYCFVSISWARAKFSPRIDAINEKYSKCIFIATELQIKCRNGEK